MDSIRAAGQERAPRSSPSPAEIFNGLQHSNAWFRVVAIEASRQFFEELPRWKHLLLALTEMTIRSYKKLPSARSS